MESYIVGGAVRDYVLGRSAHDVDHLLVNATTTDIQGMLDAGAKQVGKAFPVYILKGEQYALACKNRSASSAKNRDNYRGATLEDDLSGRDFTMNAMALDRDHHLIDPYHGVEDIMEKRVRANSSTCFLDDPLRILRAARQAAELSFDFEDNTAHFMREAVQSGLLNQCSPDRIWLETEKAMLSEHPSRYFGLLDSVGALSVIFPELSVLREVPQPEEHHPEIWTLLHTYMVLDRSVELGCGKPARFAALFHDLGKGMTEKSLYPKHIGHELRGLEALKSLRKRYPIPNDVYELSACVAVNHLRVHTSMQIKTPSKLVNLVRDIGGFRQDDGQFFEDVLIACQSDAQGRKNKELDPYPQAGFLRGAREAILSVKQSDAYQSLIHSGMDGAAFAKSLNLLEIKSAQGFIKNETNNIAHL